MGLDVPHLFSQLNEIVIDELHSLLDSERGVHLRSLLDRIEFVVHRRIRRIGLSATLENMELVRSWCALETRIRSRYCEAPQVFRKSSCCSRITLDGLPDLPMMENRLRGLKVSTPTPRRL